MLPCYEPILRAPGVHCAVGTDAFPQLHTILLRDNKLSSWGDVDSLNRLTALTDLRLTGNPILNDVRGGGRYEVRHACACICLLASFLTQRALDL